MVGYSIENLQNAGYSIEYSELGYKVEYENEVLESHITENIPKHLLHRESNLKMFEEYARTTAYNHYIGYRKPKIVDKQEKKEMESLASLKQVQLTGKDKVFHSVKCFEGEMDENCPKCKLEDEELEKTDEILADIIAKDSSEEIIEVIEPSQANEANKELVAQIYATKDVTLRKKLLKAMGIRPVPEKKFEKFVKETEKGEQVYIQVNSKQKGPATKLSLEVADLIASNMDEFMFLVGELKANSKEEK